MQLRPKGSPICAVHLVSLTSVGLPNLRQCFRFASVQGGSPSLAARLTRTQVKFQPGHEGTPVRGADGLKCTVNIGRVAVKRTLNQMMTDDGGNSAFSS